MEQKCTGRRRKGVAPAPRAELLLSAPETARNGRIGPAARGSEELRTRARGHRARSRGYQLTGRALPSSYPAADCRPTRARAWNSGTVAAPA